MSFFQVKNFEKFQHYKDRSPPWIKLYNELLDDYDFGLLPDASKMHLVAIWLLASRSENKIPYDQGWVARRINATEKVDLKLLADRGFIIVDQQLQTTEQDASNTLALCLPRDRGEAEREGETDGAPAPCETPEKRYFRRAKEVLGAKGNGIAAKLLKSKDGILHEAMAAVEMSAGKGDPAAYLGAIIRNRGGPPDQSAGRSF